MESAAGIPGGPGVDMAVSFAFWGSLRALGVQLPEKCGGIFVWSTRSGSRRSSTSTSSRMSSSRTRRTMRRRTEGRRKNPTTTPYRVGGTMFSHSVFCTMFIHSVFCTSVEDFQEVFKGHSVARFLSGLRFSSSLVSPKREAGAGVRVGMLMGAGDSPSGRCKLPKRKMQTTQSENVNHPKRKMQTT